MLPPLCWQICQMEHGWLLDFIALANTGSFTEAARARNSSQSAFSRRIQALEFWTGSRLIDRATQPVELTPAGEGFLPHAMDIVQRTNEARETMKNRTNK